MPCQPQQALDALRADLALDALRADLALDALRATLALQALSTSWADRACDATFALPVFPVLPTMQKRTSLRLSLLILTSW